MFDSRLYCLLFLSFSSLLYSTASLSANAPSVATATAAQVASTTSALPAATQAPKSTSTANSPSKPEAPKSWWNSPPGWMTWINFGAVIVAALWTLYVFVIARRDRKANRHDEFWYRSILGPRCIQPLLDLIDHSLDELRALEGAPVVTGKQPYKMLLGEFGKRKASVTNSLYLLTLFDEKSYRKLALEIDEIEDVVTLHCVANEWGRPPRAGADYQSYSSAEQKVLIIVRSMLKTFVEIHLDI